MTAQTNYLSEARRAHVRILVIWLMAGRACGAATTGVRLAGAHLRPRGRIVRGNPRQCNGRATAGAGTSRVTICRPHQNCPTRPAMGIPREHEICAAREAQCRIPRRRASCLSGRLPCTIRHRPSHKPPMPPSSIPSSNACSPNSSGAPKKNNAAPTSARPAPTSTNCCCRWGARPASSLSTCQRRAARGASSSSAPRTVTRPCGWPRPRVPPAARCCRSSCGISRSSMRARR